MSGCGPPVAAGAHAGGAIGSRLRPAPLPLWAEVLMAALVLAPAGLFTYLLAASRAETRALPAARWLDTPLDRALPLVPAAVWVYLSWYPAFALLPFAGRAVVRRGAVAIGIALVACSLGHFLLPLTIERPVLDGSEGLSVRVLAWFYSVDSPRNLFPSLHAAGAGLLTALRPRRRGLRWVVPLWAVALCASCVLVKQHYLVDVLAGFPIGLAAAAVAKRVVDGVSVDLGPDARTTSHGEAAPQPVAPR